MPLRNIWPWQRARQGESRAKAAARSRVHLERLNDAGVSGWAVGPGGGIGAITVQLDGHAAPGEVRRHDRHDVAAALSLPIDGLYGFEFTFAPAFWAQVPRDRLSELRLWIDGQPAGRPMWLASAPLDDWERLAAGHPELAGEPAPPQPDRPAARPAAPGAPDGRPAGRIESKDRLVLSGWLADPPGRPAGIELLCNGERLDVTVVRTPRDDIQAARSAEGVLPGFEIELPGLLWRRLAGAPTATLSLRADGADLEGSPFTFGITSLDAEARALQRLQTLQTRLAAMLDPVERQYRELLLLEHAAAMGRIELLAADTRELLGRLAPRFGLQRSVLGGDPASRRPAIDRREAEEDLAHWALLRELNAAVRPDGQNIAPALEPLLARCADRPALQRRLAVAALPLLSAVHQADQVAGFIDGATIDRFERASDACDTSLALPLLVLHGRVKAAADVLWRMPPLLGRGWLNTECVAHAVELALGQQIRGAGDPHEFENFCYAVIGLLDAIGQDHWSRLHDHRLIDTAITLVGASALLSDFLQRDILRCTLRHYGLQPDFWREVEAARARLTADMLERLAGFRRRFEEVRALFAAGRRIGPADLPRIEAALQPLRRLGSREADVVARQCLQALLPSWDGLDAAARRAVIVALGGISPEDTLRAALWPGVPAADVRAEAAELPDTVAALGLVPTRPMRWAQTEATQCVERLAAAGRRGDAATVAQERATLERLLPALQDDRSLHLGLVLTVLAWLSGGAVDAARAAPVERLFARALEKSGTDAPPSAAVTATLDHLALAARDAPAGPAQALHERLQRVARTACAERDRDRLGDPDAKELRLRRPSLTADTLVVIYSCRPYLASRVAKIRETWGRDLVERGIPYVVLVGDGDDTISGDVLSLAVSDRYEDLPAKTLKMIGWVLAHTDFQHLFKIDDDCLVDVPRLFEASNHRRHHYYGRRLHRPPGSTDRLWHQPKSSSERGRAAVDKSPEPSTYADGGCGYSLSRFAMRSLVAALATPRGARLVRSSFMEDKLVGDLLALEGIEVCNHDYHTMIRRRTFAQATPVSVWDNTFYPSASSPTVLAHLDSVAQLAELRALAATPELAPKRIWPTDRAPRLRAPANQLELLSGATQMQALERAQVIVIAVARNEALLLPHFLAHYRRLGAGHFVIVDNLSDDGGREYLLAQPDVTLYSADTEYRDSHFGVCWQEAVLAAHALGRWVVLADIDEFLLYDDCEQRPLPELVHGLEREGRDAAVVLMIDMYPQGPLAGADFSRAQPFQAAGFHDLRPVTRWKLGSGWFSNGPTYISALRHRMIPESAPNMYTSQKIALVRYQPWMRFSEGLHYACGVRLARRPLLFAHFKYHAGFEEKILVEITRKQHFDSASEYVKYSELITENGVQLYDGQGSRRYRDAATLIGELFADPQLA